MGNRRKPRIQQPGKMLPWLIAAGIITAIWSFVGTVGQEPPKSADFATDAGISYLNGTLVGHVLGSGLIVGGLMALLVYFVAGRRLAPGKGMKHFLVLAIVAMLAALPITALRMQALHQGVDTRRQMDAIMADHQTGADAILAEMSARDDIKDAHANVTPEAIVAPGGLARARQALDILESAREKAESDFNVLISDTGSRLSEVPTTPDQRARVMQEFERGRAMSERAMVLSGLIIETQRQQILVLERQPRAWAWNGGAFGFERRRDLEDFNAAGRTLTAAQSEFQALKAESSGQFESRP